MISRTIRAAVGWSLWLTAALVLNDLARLPATNLRPDTARAALVDLLLAGLPIYGSVALPLVLLAAALFLIAGRRREPEAAAGATPLVAGAAFAGLVLAASGSILAGEPGTGRWGGSGLLPGLMVTVLGALASGWGATRLVRSARRSGGWIRLAAIAAFPLVVLGLLALPLLTRAARRLPEAGVAPAGSASPDILLVVADSLRADALGCCGGAPGSTPALDGLVARGAAMRSATAAAPASAASVASIMTGRLPSGHGVRWSGARLEKGALTLAETLRARGYRTAAFVSSPDLSVAQGLDRGFDTWDDAHDQRLFARYPTALFSRLLAFAGRLPRTRPPAAAGMVDRALAWLALPSDRPRFLYLHLDDARDVHGEPASAGNGAEGSALRLPSLDALLRSQAVLDEEMLAEMQRRYAARVTIVDRAIGRLLDAPGGHAAGGATIVAVTADHGTELREHGSLGHGHTLYEELIHVPWILAGVESIPAGRIVDDPVSLVDLAPTLLELAGLPAEPSFRGRSRAALLTGAGGGGTASDPIVSEMDAIGFHTTSHWSRAARKGDLKVILTSTDVLGLGAWRREAYDLSTDPGERAGIREISPGVEVLEGWLRGWMRDHPHRSGAEPETGPAASRDTRPSDEG